MDEQTSETLTREAPPGEKPTLIGGGEVKEAKKPTVYERYNRAMLELTRDGDDPKKRLSLLAELNEAESVLISQGVIPPERMPAMMRVSLSDQTLDEGIAFFNKRSRHLQLVKEDGKVREETREELLRRIGGQKPLAPEEEEMLALLQKERARRDLIAAWERRKERDLSAVQQETKETKKTEKPETGTAPTPEVVVEEKSSATAKLLVKGGKKGEESGRTGKMDFSDVLREMDEEKVEEIKTKEEVDATSPRKEEERRKPGEDPEDVWNAGHLLKEKEKVEKFVKKEEDVEALIQQNVRNRIIAEAEKSGKSKPEATQTAEDAVQLPSLKDLGSIWFTSVRLTGLSSNEAIKFVVEALTYRHLKELGVIKEKNPKLEEILNLTKDLREVHRMSILPKGYPYRTASSLYKAVKEYMQPSERK